MTCRHSAGDPACSSNSRRYESQYEEPKTPDKKLFEIEECEEIGGFMVLKILYPNCKKCSYEGNKIIVYGGVTMKDVLKWREIDPHFQSNTRIDPKQAPSPIARFPASDEGWMNAIALCGLLENRIKDKGKR